MEKKEIGNMCWWLFLIAFFVLAPALTLYSAASVIWYMNEFIGGAPHGNAMIDEFYSDVPVILLTFYSGVVGGVVSYAYGRNQLSLPSDPLVTKMAKFLFAGLVGTAIFFLLRSAVLIRIFYTKLPVEQINAATLSSHSLIAASFLAGLMGPALVRGLRRRVGESEQRSKRQPDR